MNPDKQKEIQTSYKQVFMSEAGREVIEHLERVCHVKTTSFTTDPYLTAFNEGTRSVLLHIKTMVETDFDKLKEMTKQGGFEW